MTKEYNDVTIQKLLNDATSNTEASKMCLTCVYSYFREDSYDGYCRFMKTHPDHTYLSFKPVASDYLCEHWEKKNTK